MTIMLDASWAVFLSAALFALGTGVDHWLTSESGPLHPDINADKPHVLALKAFASMLAWLFLAAGSAVIMVHAMDSAHADITWNDPNIYFVAGIWAVITFGCNWYYKWYLKRNPDAQVNMRKKEFETAHKKLTKTLRSVDNTVLIMALRTMGHEIERRGMGQFSARSNFDDGRVVPIYPTYRDRMETHTWTDLGDGPVDL